MTDPVSTPLSPEALRREAEEVLDACLRELAAAARWQGGEAVVVLGCSTSEVAGARIGHGSVPAYGESLAAVMLSRCRDLGIQPAFQCCEHLNRALVLERETARRLGLTLVHAIPQPKAGGSVPAAAWRLMEDPVLAAAIRADAAIDVGDTLVGMHIRPVAVPLRPSRPLLGQARVVMAYSRLPLIGGERAVYR